MGEVQASTPEQQNPYSAAVQEVLTKKAAERKELMEKWGLSGPATGLREHFVGSAAGPTGSKEVDFTTTRFKSALSKKEIALAEAAEQQLQQGKSPDDVKTWLTERLDALHKATGTILMVTAVGNSVSEDGDQSLDAVEILHYLDEATMMIAALEVEDFLTAEGAKGNLPQVLERIADSKKAGKDFLKEDDYKYVINFMSPLEWADAAKKAETGAVLSSQQLGEGIAFGLIYAHMTEEQRMKLMETLVDDPEKRDMAVDTIIAMASTGVLEPMQAKKVLEYAQTKGLKMPAADMAQYFAAEMPEWTASATAVEKATKDFRAQFGTRLEGRYSLGGWGDVLAILVGIWGGLEVVFNLWVNKGKPNKFVAAGMAAMGGAAEVLSDGAVSRNARRLVETPSEKKKAAEDVLRDMTARRPASLEVFVSSYGKIDMEMQEKIDAKKQPIVTLADLGAVDPKKQEAMLAEYPGTPEEQTKAAEAQLTVLYGIVKNKLEIKDQGELRSFVAALPKDLAIT